jgi:predicted nucleic acid-binding protein
MSYLLDTGIFLRAFDDKSHEHEDIVLALRLLRDRDESFAVAVQNLAEFWNVSTRPVANNGYGLPVAIVLRRVQLIERFCQLHTESVSSVQHWKQLLSDYELTGVSVHDARLVSVMLSENIPRILTLNVRDFSRYSRIQALSPTDFLSSAGLGES